MEEAVGPPEAKRSRVKDSPEDNRDNQCVDLGGEDQDITVSHHGLAGPAPSSWLPSSAGSESQGGPSSVDSGLSGSGAMTTDSTGSATPPHMDEEGELLAGGRGRADEEMSELSEESGKDWKPDMTGKLAWLHRAMGRGEDPRRLLEAVLPKGSFVPPDIDRITLWKVLFNLLSEPEKRRKLENVNTLEDVVGLIQSCSRILVLTGAGVSVSCGIPDFRSKDGVYARLAVDFPDLPDPQAMFDIHYFRRDPRPFFKFAREIYPGQFSPSPCHRFIAALEEGNKLLRNYTQNIDTLEQEAGISKVVQCHGSFATASCTVCKLQVPADAIREDIFERRIPLCQLQGCRADDESLKEAPPAVEPSTSASTSSTESSGENSGSDLNVPENATSEARSPPKEATPPYVPPKAVMKPDIVFFGEGLPDHFHQSITEDKAEADLLIVIGSSLKVRPVALIPSSLPENVPQILINREPLPHCTFDVELLGDCDTIVNQICLMLGEGWEKPVHGPKLQQKTGLPDAYVIAKTELEIEEKEKEEERERRRQERREKRKEEEKLKAEKEKAAEKEKVEEKDIGENVEQVERVEEESETTNETEGKAVVGETSKHGQGEKSGTLTVDLDLEDDDDEDVEDEEEDADDGLWAPPKQLCLAEYLPAGEFSFLPPARYVFSGAEVVIEESEDEDDEDESLPEDEEQQLILPGPSKEGSGEEKDESREELDEGENLTSDVKDQEGGGTP